MSMFILLRRLGPLDAQNLRRDALLRWFVLIPLLIALPMRLLLPLVLAQLSAPIRALVMPLYQPLLSYALLILSPSAAGMAIGFLLLDQRDDGTLTALQVTPLSLQRYLSYRMAAPMLLSLPLSLLAFPLAGLPIASLPWLLLALLLAAPVGPLVALLLANFASNKVQGFALMKFASLFLMAPLFARLAPDGWRLAFGVLPTYWPAQLLWSAPGSAAGWWALGAGMVYHFVLLAALLRRFERQTRS